MHLRHLVHLPVKPHVRPFVRVVAPPPRTHPRTVGADVPLVRPEPPLALLLVRTAVPVAGQRTATREVARIQLAWPLAYVYWVRLLVVPPPLFQLVLFPCRPTVRAGAWSVPLFRYPAVFVLELFLLLQFLQPPLVTWRVWPLVLVPLASYHRSESERRVLPFGQSWFALLVASLLVVTPLP